jgi:lysophospholipase L1-like esterase
MKNYQFFGIVTWLAVVGACSPSSPGSSDGGGGTAVMTTGGSAPANSGGGTGAAMGTGGSAAATGGMVSAGGASSGGSLGTGGGAAGASGGGPGGLPGSGGAPALGGGPLAGGAPGSGGAVALQPLTVFIAGDSTVSNYPDTASPTDQAGWGQMLHEILGPTVTVDNRAAGGRTALWFYLEGAAQGILDDLAPGDYFFVQFGTNDSNKTATFEVNGMTYDRYADPAGAFQDYLQQYYVEPARAKGAIPVLVTPPPRNSAYCGTGNSLGGHSDGMRALAEREGVALLDLNQKTFDHLAGICPSPTPEDFFAFRSDGTVDGTHFQENGARHMARFLGEEMTRTELPLAAHLLAPSAL